jgi:hypothetical protein
MEIGLLITINPTPKTIIKTQIFLPKIREMHLEIKLLKQCEKLHLSTLKVSPVNIA